eukprot:CAMPEP_0175745482 /NCGR_PEP_ID=MMETSP0097-20121207/58095_1 /TAXON_ID=311494 /ORGANISM="Alexandrium monilatum, Strain CCMP3105" /LENGTH=382 /DNA_ID=CAMNT_0017053883 /DNA_START=162 /DNA_END=1310 /DNA_ORIENTATION=+
MKTRTLITKPEPLKPIVTVRLLVFWAPTLVLLTGLLCWPWFQGLGLVRQVLLGGLAGLCAICVTAYFTAVWQLKPLPTDDEMEELGGRRFRRPSDGKFMEYWLSGQLGSKTVVVFCHRMDGKMGIDYGRAKVEPMLNGRGVCLLSPTVPMVSASPPYDTIKPVQWLKQWSQDILHLLRELGAEHVYMLGHSWGAQLCLNLAMSCQEKGLLRGIALIGGFYWDTTRIQYKASDRVGGAWGKALFAQPVVVRPMAYLLIRPFLSKAADASKIPKKLLPLIQEHFGEDLGPYCRGMLRGPSYCLHQWWQVGALSAGKEAEQYVDLSKFNPAIPMHVTLGQNDNLASQQQQEFLAQVPHAEHRMFEGNHVLFPLAKIIEGLIAATV